MFCMDYDERVDVFSYGASAGVAWQARHPAAAI